MMITPRRMLAFFALVAVTALAGCAAQLPTHRWAAPQQAIELLNERSAHIHALSGRGTLMLAREDNHSIVLDAVLVAQSNHLRLRAYKFDRAVFDLTVRPDGTWIWQPPEYRDDTAPSIPSFESATEGPSLWTLIIGRVPAGSTARVERDSLIAETSFDEATLVTTIDPRTLTVQRYQFRGGGADVRPTVHLRRYRLIDGVPWPMQITLRDSAGTIDIRLDEVTFNPEFPPTAFTPPAGAQRSNGPPS